PRGSAASRWSNWLRPMQKSWSAGIHWDSVPPVLRDSVQAGACAALLTLEFNEPRPGGLFRWLPGTSRDCLTWRAEPVGDSCLFQMRDNHLLLAFPLDRPDLFNN